MKPNLLDHMKVAAPCHEDWNAMRGNDEVRFCSHCAKDVHNLSAMTRVEAEALIRKSGGRLCVRYVTRADKTIVSASPTAPLSNLTRRASKLAASAFTAALTFTPATNAQTSVTLNQTTHAEAITKQPAVQIGSGNAAIVGTVYDAGEARVAGADLKLTDSTGAIRKITTNDEGVYRIAALPRGTYTLEIESPGFKHHAIENLVLSGSSEQVFDVIMEVGQIEMGMVDIASSPAQSLVYHSNERATVSNDDETEQDERLLNSFNEIANGELKKFKVLLRSGFDVNARWHDGMTPLMVVGDEKAAKYLLELGADVHARKLYGETALMSASHNPEVVKVLLKAGADVNARDNFGVTALMYAMLGYDEKSAQVLIDAGADVNARDKDNRTALMFAAMEGGAATIKILLAAKAAHDVRDIDGKTALRFAIENNQDEAVKVLREASAVE